MALTHDWLEKESELQLQLVSSPCLREHALQLFEEQPCHVLVETISTSHAAPPHPQVTAKVLDRRWGTCETREQGEKGVPLFGADKQQMILYTARSPTFSEVVSAYHYRV